MPQNAGDGSRSRLRHRRRRRRRCDYDLAPDGRFLMVKRSAEEQPRLHVVLNWQEELKQRVPTR
jgi:hypothetical protein